METWITGGLALLVGMAAGFKFGRNRTYHVIQSINYNCAEKKITGEIEDSSPYPMRIYAYAWPQGSPPTNAALHPPLDAKCIIWYPNTTGSFTLQDNSWPNTGSVDFRVWTVDIYNTEQGQTKDCGVAVTTTTTTTTTTSSTTTPTSTTSTTSSTTTPTSTTSTTSSTTTPTSTTSTTSSTTTPTSTTSTTSSTTTPTSTTSTTSSTTTPTSTTSTTSSTTTPTSTTSTTSSTTTPPP